MKKFNKFLGYNGVSLKTRLNFTLAPSPARESLFPHTLSNHLADFLEGESEIYFFRSQGESEKKFNKSPRQRKQVAKNPHPIRTPPSTYSGKKEACITKAPRRNVFQSPTHFKRAPEKLYFNHFSFKYLLPKQLFHRKI